MELLSYAQASEILGIKLGTLYSMRSKGRIPYIRLSGRLVRFDKQELEDWVTSRKVNCLQSLKDNNPKA